MQPTNTTLSDLYALHRHHDTSQLYSYFPSQNPNPYPLHQHRHLQIESQYSSAAINPDPPGPESYLPSYSISHAGGAYNALHASGLTYSQTIAAAPPPTYASDLLVQNWAAEESVLPYGSTLYATGGSIAQDASQQQQLLTSISIPTHATWTNPTAQQPRGPWKKIPKKTKIAQSAWCEICKIECNTKDILYKHKLGKKHLKNLEKLHPAASIGTSSTSSNPVIGPVENPKKKKVETPQELEMKRRKVVEGGAAVNAVRTCTICNVVCNSDTVFRFHLGGQKHNSMLKRSQQGGGIL